MSKIESRPILNITKSKITRRRLFQGAGALGLVGLGVAADRVVNKLIPGSSEEYPYERTPTQEEGHVFRGVLQEFVNEDADLQLSERLQDFTSHSLDKNAGKYFSVSYGASAVAVVHENNKDFLHAINDSVYFNYAPMGLSSRFMEPAQPGGLTVEVMEPSETNTSSTLVRITVFVDKKQSDEESKQELSEYFKESEGLRMQPWKENTERAVIGHTNRSFEDEKTGFRYFEAIEENSDVRYIFYAITYPKADLSTHFFKPFESVEPYVKE